MINHFVNYFYNRIFTFLVYLLKSYNSKPLERNVVYIPITPSSHATDVYACLSIQCGPEIIKLFSCSIQLSVKFFLLVNVKMPTIVGISTFMGRKNSTLGLSEPKKRIS